MVSAGALIWTSIRPFIRSFLTIGAGFALNKARLFPAAATRGGAQVILNVALPCFVFSHIVPAISTHNISSLAPLVVIGVIYGVTGMLMAWIIRSFFWVPHRFRYGILAAGCWGNYGEIPSAVILGITASAPFNGVDDENLAIAYISMFILILFITLFGLGGFLLVAKDFDGPDVPSEVVQERMYRRRRRMVTNATLLLRRLLYRSQHPNARENGDVEEGSDLEKKDTVQGQGLDQNTMTGTTISPIPTIGSSNNSSDFPMHKATSSTIELPHKSADHSHHHDLLSRLWHILKQLLNPCTVVIALSFVVSLVDPLKALFIPPSSNFQPHFRPTAPDGQPPLAFIFDTATFVGGACIPLGLICLGSSLACLSLRSGGPFPQGAIASLTLAKLVILPIIGVAITRGFAHVGFVDRNDKVLQFVCILLSGLPAASSQVYLTQIYSPTGNVEHLSAFLIPQYILMPFTMTGLVAYTLSYLF